MVRNNIEVDVKVKCIEQGKTQAKLAEWLGLWPGHILSKAALLMVLFLKVRGPR